MIDASSAILKSLRPGERLLWSGRPQPWRLAAPLLFPFVFVALWATFPAMALLGVAFRARTGGAEGDAAGFPAPALALLSIPGLFLLVGTGVVITLLRQLLAAWRPHYGVTDQRAVIVVDLWPRSVRSLGPDALADVTRTGGDNLGSLRFGGLPLRGRGVHLAGATSFIGIPEPRRVETLIYETLLRKKTEGARR